jgi:hypothetical protein
MRAKILIVLLSLLSCMGLQAKTEKHKKIEIVVTEKASADERQKAKELQVRLDRIAELDYNALSASEKKAVRSEIKEIKKEVKKLGEGVYIYLGGGVLLVLLIIFLIVIL